MTRPLLSICIPTYNRSKYLDETLLHLTSETIFLDSEDIQIVISDNCSADSTEDVCRKYLQKFPKKIKYVRQKETIFAPYNIYGVLDYAEGEYLKLQNDNIYFNNDGLEKLVKIVRKENKDIIFCINRDNEEENKLKYYDNVNDIVNEISFMTTWMCAYCYRAETYRKLEYRDKYMQEWVSSPEILFRMVANKSSFVCLYENIFFNQNVEKKGGQYNVAEVFGKNYISLLREYVEQNQLSKSVFEKEKKRLLKFINAYYFDSFNQYTFQKTGYFKYIYKDYCNKPYFYFYLMAFIFISVTAKFISVEKDDTYRKFKIFGVIKFKIRRKINN